MKYWEEEDTYYCSWDGVTCDMVTGQVTGLDLSCSWLYVYGIIPSNSSLFLLSHLQKLDLAFNDFNLSLDLSGDLSLETLVMKRACEVHGGFPKHRLPPSDFRWNDQLTTLFQRLTGAVLSGPKTYRASTYLVPFRWTSKFSLYLFRWQLS
ncbi:hypothetical protein Dsin_007142 [Dipteronia sinensis]|uniref:Leucine-rich repeat-containing N-terminal plant-type domain-containing protein n=1 Tax=Dipteronia sinensis TaxID=43782 RepID=A0AAE0B0Y0_9ROSI|nr:hypothetical protein Dsin_007142 [Dipteronia sinensis]